MEREPERSETDRRIGEIIKRVIDENPDILTGGYDMKVPELDYSFLKEAERRKKKYCFPWAARVAVLLVVILAASSALALMVSDGMAGSLKSKLGKLLFQSEKEIFMETDGDEDSRGVPQSETSIQIDNIADINAAKEFLKELYIPAYIPEGYTFVSLSVNKKIGERYQGKYEYVDDAGNPLFLTFASNAHNETSKDWIRNAITVLEMEERTLYVCKEETPSQLVGYMLTGEVFIWLNSILSEEEILKVLQNLEK